ncbi:sodium:solute symporter [Rubrivirga marina]|uniref:Sodium:solute symporter n=1 Tax=Rubrivirga marina TaxID=1196024 RepID=A0A271J1P8_9BACT|nr:sodium:solute symporter [Rubrivirga marina]PAP77436.1 sodium:solute symporter [Rubrivirga marina]
MLTPLDFAVLVLYAVGIVAFGLKAGGRQTSTRDYFLGGRDLPWWAVCFSVVATETSTLTVIGVPAVAYGGALTFLQLTIGYVIGRVVVAYVLLPRYFRGELQTAYAFLGDRFGDGMRGLASVTFLVTRLLADGVRLFATAIPIQVVARAAGFEVGYPTVILAIGVVTAAYTYVGGLKAVVWMDVVQMGIYVGGAVLAVVLLAVSPMAGSWAAAAEAGKLQLLDLGMADGLGVMLTSPYALPVAVLGGAVFSMASHGTDQLIVQRILACRTLEEGRKAMVWSGIVVAVQFALFLLVGLMLWVHYGGAPLADLGLTRGDEVFPMYILNEMPPGLRGLLLAGIVAAAMSTLSSSLNALAGSTLMDLLERFGHAPETPEKALALSRVLTLVWAGVFVGFAMLFTGLDNPVVELGLGIAGFTYGGLLGAFALGLLSRRARQTDAMVAFVVTIAAMVLLIFGLWWSTETSSWTLDWRPSAAIRDTLGLRAVAWPLYPVIGSVFMVVLGSLLALRHAGADAAAERPTSP